MLALLVAIVVFIRAVSFSLRDPRFRGLLLFVTLLILSGAFFYHRVEGWGYLDAFYFCVVTLATVGYGDLTPKTAGGKIFTIFYIIFGIGVFLVFVNTIITGMQERSMEERKAKIERRKSTKRSA